jgi:uncharacterized protein (DUF1800 family)
MSALKTIAVSLTFLWAGTCFSYPNKLTEAQARHLLLRTGFAPNQVEVNRLTGRNTQEVVNELLTRAKAAVPAHPPPAFVSQPPPPPPRLLATKDEQQAMRREQMREGREAKAWWMREMIESPAPLRERMTLFWHNHFANSQQKVVRSQAMWQQNQLLRTHALGSFASLLHTIAKDPAMLVYLDGANSRVQAPNENFAREVMELFTLGEASHGGGYTEQDIREAARAFTGWSVDRDTFTYRYRPMFHDGGQKTLLGRSGNLDGDAALDVILAQPAAARFIVGKMWREFVSPEPDAVALAGIAQRFSQSGYDIAGVLRDLLLSDAFWAEDNAGSLVKSPVELVVGTVRQFGIRVDDTLPLAIKAAQLGQNLLAPPNVKGWPGYNDWINTTTLLERKRFTDQLLRVAFDADPWLAVYGARADAEPAEDTKNTLALMLLAAPATQKIATGTVGVAYVRALTLDPAFQLK